MSISRRTAWSKSKKSSFQESSTLFEYINRGATTLNDINKELSSHVTDVFQSLGNYDVRFDFDPFSIDDCRCNVVSCREMNVLCSLKHVPLHSVVIEEGDLPGGVVLKVKDDFVQKFDDVSWEDFLNTTSNGQYLDPTKVHKCLFKAICHAVYDVKTVNAVSVKVLNSPTTISLWFQLSEDSFYKVNFFPSIRVNECCENFKNLVNPFRLRQPLLDECHFEMGIHVVARPKKSSEEENKFWSVTFNDIEKRVVFSEIFECAKDCLIYFDENFKSALKGKHLSRYHIQAVVLREIFAKPTSKAWKRKYLHKRLLGMQESLNAYLRMGKCINVFTGVNLFSGTSQETLDEIANFLNDGLQGL